MTNLINRDLIFNALPMVLGWEYSQVSSCNIEQVASDQAPFCHDYEGYENDGQYSVFHAMIEKTPIEELDKTTFLLLFIYSLIHVYKKNSCNLPAFCTLQIFSLIVGNEPRATRHSCQL